MNTNTNAVVMVSGVYCIPMLKMTITRLHYPCAHDNTEALKDPVESDVGEIPMQVLLHSGKQEDRLAPAGWQRFGGIRYCVC